MSARRPDRPREPAGAPPPADPALDRPAPVVTEEGTFGTLPEDLDATLGEGGWARPFVARLALAGFVVVAVAWVYAVSAAQATSREVALPALARTVAALSEVDGLLALHRPDIAVAGASRAADPAARVALPGFPVPDATLTAIEARDANADAQRALLLSRAAGVLYDGGAGALLVEDGTAADAGLFSTEGATRRLIAALSSSNHRALGALVWPLGAVALVLGAAAVALGRGFARFVALGGALLVTAALAAAVALALRWTAETLGDDGSVLAAELTAVVAEVAWTPARHARWLAAAGLAIAIPALLLAAVFGGIRRAEVAPVER